MSDELAIKVNLGNLQKAIAQYQQQKRKNLADILLKIGGNLASFLRKRLKVLAPPKGRTRAERMAALAQGIGLLISPRVRARVLRTGAQGNLQELLVKRELSARESGRSFLMRSAGFPRTLGKLQYAKSRTGEAVSKAALNSAGEQVAFTWDPGFNPLATDVAEAMEKPKARAAIALALRDTEHDILAYLTGQVKGNLKSAGFK